MDNNEIWKPIKDYGSRFMISNHGRVMSIRHIAKTVDGCRNVTKKKIIKPCKYSNGYWFVGLSKDGAVKQFLLHRLVAAHFIGESTLEVNHKDGNKSNNCADNLEYVAHSQNIAHSYRALKREPVKSWLGKKGFEHNKSIGVKIINTMSGKELIFGSMRQAAEVGRFNRSKLASCIKTNKLYNGLYKIETYASN